MQTPNNQEDSIQELHDHPVEVIWRGHQNYSTLIKYYILSALSALIVIYLSFAFSWKFIALIILPIGFVINKYFHAKKTIFEINDHRIIMKKYEDNKYLTYEVELYDVKHIVEEEKPNGKGHIIFKTNSSLFEEITTPCMRNPTKVHDRVRDLIEERKMERNAMMGQKGKKK